ncbi:MAG: hypothetical protein HYR91_05075 [Flavobacteriia bacterium]|nr:hypothetical protein [Flavobacteriia bacterium]
MKKINYILFALSVVTLASCRKEVIVPNNNDSQDFRYEMRTTSTGVDLNDGVIGDDNDGSGFVDPKKNNSSNESNGRN